MFSRSSHSFALITALLAGSVMGPVSLSAQEADVPALGVAVLTEMATPPGVPLAERAAPLFAGTSALPLRALIAWPSFTELAPAPYLEVLAVQDRVRAGPNIAMMAVGGAALVVGLAMNNDTGMIIAATGGVIALVGLYRYLR